MTPKSVQETFRKTIDIKKLCEGRNADGSFSHMPNKAIEMTITASEPVVTRRQQYLGHNGREFENKRSQSLQRLYL